MSNYHLFSHILLLNCEVCGRISPVLTNLYDLKNHLIVFHSIKNEAEIQKLVRSESIRKSLQLRDLINRLFELLVTV